MVVGAQNGDYGVGITRGMVDGFLMSDGMPIYASSGYKGDKTISDVRIGRDSRLNIFLKEPGQKNVLFDRPKERMLYWLNPILLSWNLLWKRLIRQVMLCGKVTHITRTSVPTAPAIPDRLLSVVWKHI